MSGFGFPTKYGSTPVEMKAQAVQTVSATLGKDSLHAGIVSGLIGIFLVLLFMLFYYRALALVVAAGLAVTGAILWSVIAAVFVKTALAQNRDERRLGEVDDEGHRVPVEPSSPTPVA